MKQYFRQNSGFTLIELIIVIFIMGILSVAMILNFRDGEKTKRVSLARDTVISAVRYAQNQALSGTQIPRTAQHVRGSNSACSDYSLVSSWVEFASPNSVSVMVENRCGGIKRLTSYDVPAQVRFEPSAPFAITVGGTATDHMAAAVRVTPPFARMTVSGDANPLPANFSEFGALELHLEHISGDRDLTVTIDGISGKIE